jgi:hypothetical protein
VHAVLLAVGPPEAAPPRAEHRSGEEDGAIVHAEQRPDGDRFDEDAAARIAVIPAQREEQIAVAARRRARPRERPRERLTHVARKHGGRHEWLEPLRVGALPFVPVRPRRSPSPSVPGIDVRHLVHERGEQRVRIEIGIERDAMDPHLPSG